MKPLATIKAPPLLIYMQLASYCDVFEGALGGFFGSNLYITPSHFYNKNLQPIILLDLIGFLMDQLGHLGVFYGTPKLRLDGR